MEKELRCRMKPLSDNLPRDRKACAVDFDAINLNNRVICLVVYLLFGRLIVIEV